MTNIRIHEIRMQLERLKHPQTFVATVDSDGAPQVRPMTLMYFNNEFYLATFRSSDKAVQIAKDNRLEFVTPFCEGSYSGYLRVMGVAEEIKDTSLAEKITIACSYPVLEYWRSVRDPDFLFIKIKPLRVKFMKPGEEYAVEVTDEFVK